MEIVGFPNYLIYEDGRVYNQKYNRFLKQCVNSHGYFHVNLRRDGKTKLCRIHRLIAQHYISNPENKPCIDHIDRNKLNNNISNLRWVTHKENMNNCSIGKNNKSGHINISYDKLTNLWRFQKKGYKYNRFKLKRDCLCYKYIMILRIKARHFH